MSTLSGSMKSGLCGFDKIIDGLRLGDNVVFEASDIAEYRVFVQPFVENAISEGKRVVYMRFAQHEPLILNNENVYTYKIDPYEGFEHFSAEVHRIVTEEGIGVYYVFDCLSDLLSVWATDLMIGNFFYITCPYLFELNTIAYFAIYRNINSIDSVAIIREITQLFLSVFSKSGEVYIHPLKVWKRSSPTMFLPHKILNSRSFVPVTNSGEAARLSADKETDELADIKRYLDRSDRIFLEAAELIEKEDSNSKFLSLENLSEDMQPSIDRLVGMMFGRDRKAVLLVKKVFSFDDLLQIKSRLIGSGQIGGKALGMLLARKILKLDKSLDWENYLEYHDSYYIGSDVFYTYIVRNGLWKLRMSQKSEDGYFKVAERLREEIPIGTFPEYIKEQFKRMLEYFGQSPIIARSSSLLEDGFGNAFAGKYESVFCINQGSPEQRYQRFEEAVKKVFASSMNESALAYRLQRNLHDKDEQMALLVQRVSGDYHGKYFLPDVAGVGLSFNSYVWNGSIEPEAGMLRLVLGLGTRAVDRVEGDYARIVALNSPLLQPFSDNDEAKRFSQHELDVLNIAENIMQTIPVGELSDTESGGMKKTFDLCTEIDFDAERRLRELNLHNISCKIVNFKKLLSETNFPYVMSDLLKILAKEYSYPVDTEFTVNFDKDGYRINLLQCRPLQTKGLGGRVALPENIDKAKVLFESSGNFMGGNISRPLKRVILTVPKAYLSLKESEKYDVARAVGKLNRLITDRESMPTMLLGPGRWGTTTPSLGVPVSFSEINRISVIGEIAYTEGGFTPELSFGSHFFQDIVELEMFYVAIFPDKPGIFINDSFFDTCENELCKLLPEYANLSEALKVYSMPYGGVQSNMLLISADILTQKVICCKE